MDARGCHDFVGHKSAFYCERTRVVQEHWIRNIYVRDWPATGWLAQSGVAVEKGTKAVISMNFSVYGRRTFNNLRTNFALEIP
jgi:hypothetical protein